LLLVVELEERLAVTMDLVAAVPVVCLLELLAYPLQVIQWQLAPVALHLVPVQHPIILRILMVGIRQSQVRPWPQLLQLVEGLVLLNQALPELHQTVALVVVVVDIPAQEVWELLVKATMVVSRHNPETAVAVALVLQAAMEILQMEELPLALAE